MRSDVLSLSSLHVTRLLSTIIMRLEEIIRTELEPLLKKHGFKTSTTDLDNVNFQSSKLTLSFFYNLRESSFIYWLKHVDFEEAHENWMVEKFLEIEREVVFGEFSLEQKAINWAKWGAQYFKENENRILDGEDSFYKDLDRYSSDSSIDYNNRLQLNFIQKQISEALYQKDYRTLANLKISGISGISPSEMKKIEIARKKIKHLITAMSK